jgi:hypothetical protein
MHHRPIATLCALAVLVIPASAFADGATGMVPFIIAMAVIAIAVPFSLLGGWLLVWRARVEQELLTQKVSAKLRGAVATLLFLAIQAVGYLAQVLSNMAGLDMAADLSMPLATLAGLALGLRELRPIFRRKPAATPR